jgi:hypothetical protein
MRFTCLLLVLTLFSFSRAAIPPLTASDDAPALSEDLIARVNSAASSWTAGWNNKFASMTVSQARDMLGVFPKSRRTRLPRKPASASGTPPSDVPASFDARLQWPSCASIRHVRDQGPCGSCWFVLACSCPRCSVMCRLNCPFIAPLFSTRTLRLLSTNAAFFLLSTLRAFGAAEAMSDRICISSGQINQTEVSAQVSSGPLPPRHRPRQLASTSIDLPLPHPSS